MHIDLRKVARFFGCPRTSAHQNFCTPTKTTKTQALWARQHTKRVALQKWMRLAWGEGKERTKPRELDDSFGWEQVALLDVAVDYSRWDHKKKRKREVMDGWDLYGGREGAWRGLNQENWMIVLDENRWICWMWRCLTSNGTPKKKRIDGWMDGSVMIDWVVGA